MMSIAVINGGEEHVVEALFRLPPTAESVVQVRRQSLCRVALISKHAGERKPLKNTRAELLPSSPSFLYSGSAYECAVKTERRTEPTPDDSAAAQCARRERRQKSCCLDTVEASVRTARVQPWAGRRSRSPGSWTRGTGR